MSKFDIAEISALLHVHEKAMGHPKLKAIADQAMAELEAMLPKKPEPEVVSEPEEKPEHE